MATTTEILGLYKPEDGEPPTQWAPELNTNMDTLEMLFSDRIQVHDGDVQTYDYSIQLY